MSTYGRNFEFRVPPESQNRSGRYYLNAVADVAIGAPVKVSSPATADSLGLIPVELATGAQAKPAPGQGGVLVYEHGPAAYAGDDPWLTTYSDKSNAPHGKAVQVVNGEYVKVVLRNTADETFLNTRDYDGVTFVAGLGATLTLAVGDYLTPGVGNGTDGYWAETGTAANAWLVITKVDNDRGEVEARLNF
jgi:hypothetical protein